MALIQEAGGVITYIYITENYCDWLYSQATEKTGGTVTAFNAEATIQTKVETATEVGVKISFYDPEIQALLAYEN